MKVYVGLRGYAKGKSIGWEFQCIATNPYEVGRYLYGLGLDGDETNMLEYETSLDSLRTLDYREKFKYAARDTSVLRPQDV